MHPMLMMQKMGYDPTQSEIWEDITSYLEAKGNFTALDICCANGAALTGISDLLGASYDAYGSELDLMRYKEAVQSGKFTKVLMGDFRKIRMSHNYISLQLCNPPYSYEIKEKPEDPTLRTEEVALAKATNYMAIGGVLIGVWPFSLFKDRGIAVLRHLHNFYDNIQFLQYPKVSESQVIVLAAKRYRTGEKEEASFFSTREGHQWLEGLNKRILQKQIPELVRQESPCYKLPVINPKRVDIRIDYYDKNVAEMEIQSVAF